MSNLRLSLIIPVYNEQRHLRACLDAVATQEVMPFEVIVVDNNSTDRSVAIARSYPFVRVVHESKQHQAFAQAKGFNIATGDILGRIDADTILAPDWTARVLEYMGSHDSVQIASGDAVPYDVPFAKGGAFVFRFYHHYVSRIMGGRTMILGANFAIRRDSWIAIRDHLHYRADIWEDFDMAFHVPKGTVHFVREMQVAMSFRAGHKEFRDSFNYQARAIRTIGLHVSPLRKWLFAIAWATLIPLYPGTVVDRYLQKRRERLVTAPDYGASFEV